MEKFDFIECASQGYRSLWNNRQIIARLAIPVLLIKFVSYFLIYLVGLKESYFAQGILLIPSSFCEGLLIAALIRKEMFQEKITYPLQDKSRTDFITATAIGYTLSKIALSFISAILLTYGFVDQAQNIEATPPSAERLLVNLIWLVFIFWSFRLYWLYIAIAMEIPLMRFLKKLKLFPHTFIMIGIWMVSSLPIMMIVLFATQLIIGLLSAMGLTFDNSLEYIAILSNGFTELIVSIVTSIAMAHAAYSLIIKKSKNEP